MIRIGIDPDINKSGVSIMINGKLRVMKSMSFYDLIKNIENNFHRELDCFLSRNHIIKVHYYVEHVELIKTVWNRKGMSQAAKIKVAQNVGMVKAVGRLIGQKLDESKREYELIPPLRGHLKKGKKDAEFFNRLMEWSGRSNADNRDAALLLHPFLNKGGGL